MRVLFASTRGAGHLTPLVPFLEACLRDGHDVLVCGPPAAASAVQERGYPFREFDPPPEEELGAVWARVPALPPDEQNRVVIGDVFARLSSAASLPGLTSACEGWRPDVVVRDPNEYGSALAAELHGIPHARVGICLAAMEEWTLRVAAGPVDELRRRSGLEADPDARRLRESPFLTLFPPSLEDSEPVQPHTFRFRDPTWDQASLGAPSTSGSKPADSPLVYVSFGSVAGGMEMSERLYGPALEAVAGLPVRVLLTTGHERGLDGPVPDNVRVERWVPQAQVLPHAAAVVCHGGSGTTLGALAAGVPLVIMPLFADQPENARRVAAVGAGLAVAPPNAVALRDALEAVLADDAFRTAARRLAAEMRALPPADAAVECLSRLAAA